MAKSLTTDFAACALQQHKGDRQARLARYLGEIVSAASVMPTGEQQICPVRCRRRPGRRRCPGSIEVTRAAGTDTIEWRCSVCGDRGSIANWRHSRWDLAPEPSGSKVVSLSAARARRAQRSRPAAARVYEMMAELIDGPIPLEQLVMRRVRISGDLTLHDLHRVIAQAYERDPDDAYEFMFGALYEIDARRFTGVGDVLVGQAPLCETQQLRLDDLGLQLGQVFGYLANFDAEWVHRLTVLSVARGPAGAKVVERIGHVPDLGADGSEEEWAGELVWDDDEIDDDCPLTDLHGSCDGPYGSYDGTDPPDAESWASMEELERLLLVLEGHSHSLPRDHDPVEAPLLHALLHQMAETALFEGDAKACAQLQRQLRHGTGRHAAIHEIGERMLLEQISRARVSSNSSKREKR